MESLGKLFRSATMSAAATGEVGVCNGSAEAIVKQLNFSLKNCPRLKLSLLELKTLIYHIAHSINIRPLGICRDLVQPITPNHLIMGRKFPYCPYQNVTR